MAATTYELIVKTVDQSSGPLGKITGKLGGAKVAFAAVAAAVTATSVAMIQASKKMETITNQLKLVTKNSKDLAATQQRLTELARANRSTLGPTVELYTKLKVATEELGFSNQRVEGLVTKLTQALVVAGADAGTTSGVIRQFGQAMASGTVRGDEFNSIVEGLGPALAIMARESGVTVGQLREMSQNGELTAAAFAALLEGSNELTESFKKMATPLDTLEDQLSEAFTTYLANLSESIGLTSSYRSLLESLVNKFDAANKSFADSGASIAELTQHMNNLKSAQAGLDLDQGGHAGRNAKRRSEELQIQIDKTIQAIGILKQEAAAEAEVAKQKKAAADAMAFKNKMEEAAKTVALQSIEGYLKLADSVKNVNAAFQMATPIEQAKMRLEQLVTAQRNIAQAQNDGVISVENFHIRMRGLSESIILQEHTIKQLIAAEEEKLAKEKELAEAALQRASASQRIIANIQQEKLDLQDLNAALANAGEIARMLKISEDELTAALQAQINVIKGVKDAQTERATASERIIANIQQQAIDLQNLTATLAEVSSISKRLGLDEAKLTEELKKQIDAINGVTRSRDKQKQGMQTYQEFLAQINKTAEESVIIDGYKAQALKDLFKEYDNGRISLEQFKAAQDALGVGTNTASKTKKPVQLTAAEQLTKRLKEQKLAFDSLNMSQEQIAKSAAAAGVSQDVFRRELDKTRESMNIFKTDAQIAAEELQQGFMQAGEALGNELGAAIANGEDIMDSFRNFFKRTLTLMLQDILTSGIQNAMAGQFGGMSAGGGGFNFMSMFGGGSGSGFGGMFGSGGAGGLFGGSLIPGFLAEGGVAQRGKPYIVGEKGSELFMPGTTGRVTSADETADMLGGGPTINFNISAIDSRSGTEFILENKQQIVGVINQAYNKRGRRGIV